MDAQTPDPAGSQPRRESEPPAPDRPGSAPPSPRGTAVPWIVAAICALAAIGLGIWAFTTKSDLDDANATIERQKERLASQAQTATAEERRLQAFGRRERAAFRRVRRRLASERAKAGQLEQKVEREAATLEQTRQQVANAQGAEQREAAELRRAQAATRLAAACSQSAVQALNKFFNAATVRAGANRAVAQLQSTQTECRQASQGG
jgi:hypothetical protein